MNFQQFPIRHNKGRMLVTLELWGVTQVWLYPSKTVLQWFVMFLQHLVRVTILEDIFEKFYSLPFSL